MDSLNKKEINGEIFLLIYGVQEEIKKSLAAEEMNST